MRCTQEQCTIKDTIGDANRFTMHDCRDRTTAPTRPGWEGYLHEYPGFIEGSAREKKLKRFLQESACDIRLDTGEEVIVVDPDAESVYETEGI